MQQMFKNRIKYGLLSVQQKDLMKMMKMNSYAEWKKNVQFS